MQSWSLLLTGNIQSSWFISISFLLGKVNRNKRHLFSFEQFKSVWEGKKNEKWVHAWSVPTCGSKQPATCIPTPAQGRDWDAHRAEIDEGTTSARVGNLPWKRVTTYPLSGVNLQSEKVQAILLSSIYRLRIVQKICLWIDFGRAASWCDTWLSAPCVLHHNTENLTSAPRVITCF